MKVNENIWCFLFLPVLIQLLPCYFGARVSDTAITNDDRTNLAEMNLTEQNTSGAPVNITSSSIIGPTFDTRAGPAVVSPPLPQAPLLQPQPQPVVQPMQQTINDIISSIQNAITQSASTAASASIPSTSSLAAAAVPAPPAAQQSSPAATISISTSPAQAPTTVISVQPPQPASPIPTIYGLYPSPILNYMYAYPPPQPPPDQLLPLFGNFKAASDAIDNALYTASNPWPYQWPTPFSAWVYPSQ